MMKKWLLRAIAFIFIVMVILCTRNYYIHVAKPFAEEQAKQKAIWEEKARQNALREEQKKLEEQKKAEEEKKKAEEEQKRLEEELAKLEAEKNYEKSEATGDDYFIDLSHFKLWETGEYSADTGEKVDNKRRLRYPEKILVECPEYCVVLSEGFTLYICEYGREDKLLRVIPVKNGEKYMASKEAETFSVSLRRDEGEKSLSYGQWNGVFSDGIEAKICTEKWLEYSVSDLGNLIIPRDTESALENMRDLLLAGEDDILSDLIWNEQIKSGIYSLTGEELDNNRLIYYVSSSEGDDNNTGLDIEHPKKTLDAFSNVSNVNILLKCGDVFDMKRGIHPGSNYMMASYGEGRRPILNFYRDFEIAFEPQGKYDNLWVADLSTMNHIITENKNKSNCNIGQLLINGEVNWKRFVWSSKVEFDPEDMLSDMGCWAVDWTESKLYFYIDTDPNNLTIKYSLPVTAFEIDKSHDVTIKGLEIRGSGKHGCNISDSKNVAIKCCYFSHIGGSILVQAGVRYGNAVQVWDSGSDINVSYNYSSWIFDTCYTNQGTDDNAVCDRIHFSNNIGAHFFWGIETWGDGFSNNPFTDIVYDNNILFDNIDITNPNTPMYAGENSKLIGIPESEYVSYRNGYKYHQMSSINVSNSGTGDVVRIDNNIAWQTNRFLVLANNSRNEEHFSALSGNYFFCKVSSEDACLFRYTKNDKKQYKRMFDDLPNTNRWNVIFGDTSRFDYGQVECLLPYLVNISGIDSVYTY